MVISWCDNTKESFFISIDLNNTLTARLFQRKKVKKYEHTHFFQKFFGKIVYNIVCFFLYENKVLYDYQFGFRSKHSTQHALITLVERITTSLDVGNIVISLFIDFKKAFDTVSQQI